VKAERFARIKDVLLEAVELSGDERRAFLDEACREDPEMRREIDSMLENDQKAQEILRSRPGVPGRQPSEGSTLPGLIGRVVSHYRILELRGEGGMGVVFRAADLELDREVALKCPWSNLVADPHCRRRFLREAKAASRIQHANIIQVLDTFEEDGLPWLVLQYVQGPDLASLLAAKGRLPVETVLRYSHDLASALKSAHDRKVLHRDIKPRNVLISPDDRALLGDFGLAQILETPDGDSVGHAGTSTLTPAGMVVGTPRYMSPEQALGRPLDKRSDLFSLGTLMYEMCTGQPAFSASERGSLHDAIIHKEPEPIARLNYEVPTELERIIRKAMAKPADERYQDAGDVLADLRALQRRLEYSEYSQTHPAATGHRTRRVGWYTGLALVLVVTVVLLWTLTTRLREEPLPQGQPSQVTWADAWAGQPQISPDGTRIAFASNMDGNFDVYVADVHGGTPLRLTDRPEVEAYPEWFPDGRALAFVRYRRGESEIWKTGQLGGGATLILTNAGQPAISRDGTRLAFVRAGPGGYGRIGVALLSDTTRLSILTDEKGGLWDHTHPTWSPDGRRICYSTRHGLRLVPSTGGASQRLTTEADLDIDPVWSPAGKHIYFASYREATLALWRIPVKGGQAERVTLGDTRHCQPSLSLDGTRLAYATENPARRLVLRDLVTGQETAPPPLADVSHAAISPDQRQLVFVSARGGENAELWLQPLEGGKPAGAAHRLTEQPGDASHPTFSPDGRWIAYYRIIEEERNIWTIPSGGGQPTRITVGPGVDGHPDWSPDGSALAFVSESGDERHLWVVPVTAGRGTGPARSLPDGVTRPLTPDWSPEGTWIAFVGQDSAGAEAWVISPNGRTPPRRLTRGAAAQRVRWDASRGDLLVCGSWGQGRYSLRRVSVPDGRVVPLEPPVDLGLVGSPPYFDISDDGQLLAFTREEMKGEIWLLETREGKY
jgi:Tol biopolymer transport system component/serine/threonine protein kinase